MSLAARLVLSLVLLALAGAAGWRQGVRATLADWHAADLARERAQADAQRELARLARQAAGAYETQRAAAAAAQPEVRRVIDQALQAPAACVPESPLAGLVLPGDVFDGLRHAAGAVDTPGAAAAEPGPAVP